MLNGDKALDMDLDSDCEPEVGDKAERDEKPKHEFRSILERKLQTNRGKIQMQAVDSHTWSHMRTLSLVFNSERSNKYILGLCKVYS